MRDYEARFEVLFGYDLKKQLKIIQKLQCPLKVLRAVFIKSKLFTESNKNSFNVL